MDNAGGFWPKMRLLRDVSQQGPCARPHLAVLAAPQRHGARHDVHLGCASRPTAIRAQRQDNCNRATASAHSIRMSFGALGSNTA
jgi:hypothetical protein